jgi:molybdopterin-guanine dinucleotide biosynthesis protein A
MCLRALEATSADGLLVVCCDQPLLRPDLLRRLLPQPPGACAVFHRCRGESMAPFPGYFPHAALADLRAAFDAGERSPRRWAAQRECEYIDLLPEEAGSLQSANTPEALATLPPSPH